MTVPTVPLPQGDRLTPWTFGDAVFEWGRRTHLMGILNITPDSFSDGGDYNTLGAALDRAHRFVEAGADILDIGGQSTRPNADMISPDEEMERVVPVILALRQGTLGFGPLSTPISIDTTHATVAREALNAGADIINDVSGGTYDGRMFSVALQLGAPVILMHLRGTPKTMQTLTTYDDVVTDICDALRERAAAAEAAGIPPSAIALDPGLGFAKTGPQNLEILRRLPEVRALGYPLLVGPSRKRFIGDILQEPDPKERIWGTAATCAAAIAGGADILRVHDVAEMADVCQVSDRIWRVAPDEP